MKPKIIETWCGSRVTADRMPLVLKGWQHYAKKLRAEVEKLQRPNPDSLEYQLTEILSRHCGERGRSEGAVDTLCRLIGERDAAMTILALDRIQKYNELPMCQSAIASTPRFHSLRIKLGRRR